MSRKQVGYCCAKSPILSFFEITANVNLEEFRNWVEHHTTLNEEKGEQEPDNFTDHFNVDGNNIVMLGKENGGTSNKNIEAGNIIIRDNEGNYVMLTAEQFNEDDYSILTDEEVKELTTAEVAE